LIPPRNPKIADVLINKNKIFMGMNEIRVKGAIFLPGQ